MSNIINMILENQNKQKAENQQKFEANLPVLDANTVFVENSPMGIISKPSFAELFNSDREVLENLNEFVNLLNSQKKIQTSITPKLDRYFKEYFWISAKGVNGELSFKLPNFVGLSELLKAHINRTHIFKFNLEELYQEVSAA